MCAGLCVCVCDVCLTAVKVLTAEIASEIQMRPQICAPSTLIFRRV